MNNTKKKITGNIAACIFLLFFGLAAGGFFFIPDKNSVSVSTIAVDDETVLAGGTPIGIYLKTDGVMVLGTEHITDVNGEIKSPAGNIVKKGDYITDVNGRKIHDKNELISAVENSGGSKLLLGLRRDGEKIKDRAVPVKAGSGKYMLGIWVRDDAQGMGTITFMTKDSRFGALGHGIHDIDTNGLIEISKGSVYKTSVRVIDKGKSGNPGSMEGVIVYSGFNRIGRIYKNTDEGIFGTIDKPGELFKSQKFVKTAGKEEIEKGKASMRCFVDGATGEYDIEIIAVDYSLKEKNKGMVIQVTDERLLKKTGGIVRGMSGAPIFQNGKLIGAVTHVFVNDSRKGYGIFIENMLEK